MPGAVAGDALEATGSAYSSDLLLSSGGRGGSAETDGGDWSAQPTFKLHTTHTGVGGFGSCHVPSPPPFLSPAEEFNDPEPALDPLAPKIAEMLQDSSYRLPEHDLAKVYQLLHRLQRKQRDSQEARGSQPNQKNPTPEVARADHAAESGVEEYTGSGCCASPEFTELPLTCPVSWDTLDDEADYVTKAQPSDGHRPNYETISEESMSDR